MQMQRVLAWTADGSVSFDILTEYPVTQSCRVPYCTELLMLGVKISAAQCHVAALSSSNVTPLGISSVNFSDLELGHCRLKWNVVSWSMWFLLL